MALVLVVDDVAALAEQYAYDLERIGGLRTLVATSGSEALALLASDPVDCMILDLEMPGMDGFEVLREMKRRSFSVPVIVYTGAGSYDRCVQAVRLGAYGFIDKDEAMERVAREVENALERTRLQTEVSALRREAGAESILVGSSAAMQKLRDDIARVAGIPSAVLITGESGTGKELVAREIHNRSGVARGPFVAINCAALPESLIESELFGHERGAFTGANRTRRGAFEQASGGTLFLDEIGELPAAAQAKMLRVLEARTVTRLGAEGTIDVDARVVAATHRDLEAEIHASRFREDLYYRLNVHILAVPPLRDRREDIAELARHFAELTCERFGIRNRPLDAGAVAALSAHDWQRNNVRELRNIIERMVIASEGDRITESDVPADLRGGDAPSRGTLQEQKADAERRIIIAALERNDWHLSRTASELGLSDHSSLTKILRRLGIRRSH